MWRVISMWQLHWVRVWLPAVAVESSITLWNDTIIVAFTIPLRLQPVLDMDNIHLYHSTVGRKNGNGHHRQNMSFLKTFISCSRTRAWRSSVMSEVFSYIGGLQLCWKSSVISEVFSYVGSLQLYRRTSVISEVFSYIGGLQFCRKSSVISEVFSYVGRSSVMPVFEFKLLLQMKRHHCTIPNV